MKRELPSTSNRRALRALRGDYRKIARIATKAGWTLRMQGDQHIAWFPPGAEHKAFRSSVTPRDTNAQNQLRRDLKKFGLEV